MCYIGARTHFGQGGLKKCEPQIFISEFLDTIYNVTNKSKHAASFLYFWNCES